MVTRTDAVIIGVGYVGLPLAHRATECGLGIVGFDVDQKVVDQLNQGRSHVDDLSDADVAAMVDRGFRASADPSIISAASTVVICVPTPLGEDGGPDLKYVQSAAETIAQHIKTGQTIVLESTTYPGTTEEVVLPILERSGLSAGLDFHLAFSPERVDPGNPTYGIANTPKIVGGLTPECTQAAMSFYQRFIDQVIAVSGTREAEMTKLLENTYRHINIALVNEIAQFCHELDIDVWEVIAGAATKPFGFQAFYPGPGVGGHCIPIDPNYLSFKVKHELDRPFRFVELAQEINESMPEYVASRISDLLMGRSKNLNGATVVLMGVTYKPNISDERESPAVPLANILMNAGAEVLYADPYVENWSPGGTPLTRVEPSGPEAAQADICVLLQNHRGFDSRAIAENAALLLDTRGTLTGENVTRL